MRLKLLLLSLLSFLFSCSSDKTCDNVDVSGITEEVIFTHLTNDIRELKSPKEIEQFLDSHKVYAHDVMGRGGLPDSIFIDEMVNRVSNEAFKKLADVTLETFDDYASLEKEISDALKRVKYYYPDYPLPSIITGITGFADNTQLVNLGSAIFIGLDYFLGVNSPYQPNTFDYMKPFYRKEMIARSVVFAKVGPEIIKTKQMTIAEEGVPAPVMNSNVTLLDEMINFGRLFYFTKKTLNCPHDTIVTGFTADELAIINSNKDMLWEHFIKNEILYSTDHMMKVRYLEPRPFTNEISQDCPGRLGQWYGYQIVRQYMETHPDVSLPALMEMTDGQKIFAESKFRP